MTNNNATNIPLPTSLRKHIRLEKARLRKDFGENSEEYKKFIEWVGSKREEKLGIGALKVAE